MRFDRNDTTFTWQRKSPAGWPRDDNCEARVLLEKTLEETGCPFAWFFSDDPTTYAKYKKTAETPV